LTGLPREMSIKASASLRSEGIYGTRLPQTGVSRNTEKRMRLLRRTRGRTKPMKMVNARRPEREARNRKKKAQETEDQRNESRWRPWDP